MKKFYKTCIILVVICIAFGFSLCLAGTISGASPIQLIRDGKLGFSIGRSHESGTDDDASNDHHANASHHLTEHADAEENVENSIVETYAFSDVKNLEISVDAADMNIYTESTDQIIIEYPDNIGNCKSELKGNKLYIKQEGGLELFGSGSVERIDIYIPFDAEFENVKIDLDIGSIYIEEIIAKNMLEIDVDAGSVICDDYFAKNIKADADAGSIQFYGGNFIENAELDCDAGSIEFYVDGSENSMNYELESDIGQLEINGDEYRGLSVEKKVNNGAGRTLKADVDAGSIQIYTSE